MSAPSMSTNKVIHHAFRRDLARLQKALADFTDGDTARATDLRRGWDFFDKELSRHHDAEHRIAWPALLALGVPQATLDEFDVEHEAMSEALSTAREAMSVLAGSATRANADLAAAAIDNLGGVAGTHLDHEEAVAEPVMAQNHGHPALKEMGKKFARDQSLTVAAEYFAWVTHGATDEEMAALKSEVPGPVLAILPKLFGRRYYKEIAPIWS
jgi:hemerythrin-like domain-containing protein